MTTLSGKHGRQQDGETAIRGPRQRVPVRARLCERHRRPAFSCRRLFETPVSDVFLDFLS